MSKLFSGRWSGPATANFTLLDGSAPEGRGTLNLEIVQSDDSLSLIVRSINLHDGSTIRGGYSPTFEVRQHNELWFNNGKGPKKVGVISDQEFNAKADVNGQGWVWDYTGRMVDGQLVYSFKANKGSGFSDGISASASLKKAG